MPNLLIADDHPLFREALSAALRPVIAPLSIVESDSLNSLISALQENSNIDLVLLDLHMPGCENFYGLIRLTNDYPNLPIAVISASDSEAVIAQVMRFGAKGFIPKSTPTVEIARAIRLILQGHQWLPDGMEEKLEAIDDDLVDVSEKLKGLTPKQFEVLKKLQNGLMNKQIAHDMNVTEATVKAHISAIFKKLNVNTRTQAVLMVEKLELD